MRFAKTLALIAGAVLAAGTAVPAEAAGRYKVDLHGSGLGSFVLDDTGAARITGQATGIPFDGSYSAVLTADDGTLPEPGVCESATATVDLTGPKDAYLTLAATGSVCGKWPDATYVVTHNFIGRYQVVDSSVRRTVRTDGWINLLLATEGRANFTAIDT